MDMPARQPRRREQPAHLARDLTYVTARGGRLRQHRYLGDIRRFAGPVVLAVIVQTLIYGSILAQAGRTDWENIALVVGVLAFVPIVSAAVLTGFRHNEAPIIVASVVSVALFSVAISTLSALRIPVSYFALSLCLPATMVLMVYANIRFRQRLFARSSLAPFSRARAVSEALGGIPIIEGPKARIDDIESLLIDPVEHHREEWSPLLAQCYLRGIEILPWTRYQEVQTGRLDVASFDVSHIAYSPSQLLYARIKRWLDVLAVIVTLPLTLPIGGLVALYIRILDGGPVLFVQDRRGYRGKPFRMFKFRTMYKGSSGGATRRQDKRIMPGCRIIRKLRLDELPQLVNILRGEMSLVGPRPVAEYIAHDSEALDPKYALRTLVLPGITGWAQVQFRYAASPEEEIEKLSYDLYYIKHLSLDLDLLILFKTVGAVLFRGGAH
ncbi:sugar transferase [Cucumibacter marinus]|uniref:sugar transferase n=1 Tax=Cucumibacter marinus TaxID=1121252 RepID=UPI00041932EB|nr:sugar transferase [Cucumibacter marinus]